MELSVWVPHAHRLLRPGGRLICHSVLDVLCSPMEDELRGGLGGAAKER